MTASLHHRHVRSPIMLGLIGLSMIGACSLPTDLARARLGLTESRAGTVLGVVDLGERANDRAGVRDGELVDGVGDGAHRP